MGKNKDLLDEVVEEKKNKSVHNRGIGRVELTYNGKVYVFLPNKVTNVPKNMTIPKGMNLVEEL